MANLTHGVQLREVAEADLPIFFEYQRDPDANHMAAFTARDPSDIDTFMAHWAKILADDTIIKRTILSEGQVAGNIVCFGWQGKREVGYWLGREHWGKGLATRALAEFLAVVTERPLYAAAAKDNAASIRVLEKCGFVITGYDRGFSNARGEEIEEVMLELK
ncbi:MAG TPA: GNAT family N-acetyltransferase [Chloroflexia bacterium]|nr:GNAT family N-acetyltransferase [Chloroflexia bacterium]